MSRSVSNNDVTRHGVMVNNIKPSMKVTEAGQSLSSRQDCFTIQVWGFQGYTEDPYLKKKILGIITIVVLVT